MLTWTLSIPRAQRVDHVQGHPDVAHQDLHRGLGVLVLEEELDSALLAAGGHLADAVDEPRPGLAVRRLERVVVALDAGPEDHLRPDGGREVAGCKCFGECIGTNGVVR